VGLRRLLFATLVATGCGGTPLDEERGATVAASRTDVAPASDAIVYEHEVGGNVDIYVVAATGGVPRRLTSDPTLDCHARWMPGGRRIVFTTDRRGRAQLWEVAAEGGVARPLRRNGAAESQPDPSPDGRQLAFISDIEGSDRLMLMDLETRVTTTLVRHPDRTMFGNPDWSANGSRIVFSSDWPSGHQIYTVEVVTRQARPLPSAPARGCEPRWRNDGRAVAFVLRDHPGETSQLVEQDLDTGARRVLVDWPALNYDLAYSPDGSEVAFASNISGQWAIYRQRLSDGRAWRLTFGGGPARYPDYRPRPAAGDP
jgi:Tol biopolymer transport system component